MFSLLLSLSLPVLPVDTFAVIRPTGDEISRLVAQLDDRDFRVRDRATRRLRMAGLEAVGRLRQEAEVQPSPEVRARLAEAIAGIVRVPWRGDLTEARAEARRTGRPILAFSTV